MFANNKFVSSIVLHLSEGFRKAATFVTSNHRVLMLAFCFVFVIAASAQGNVDTGTGVTAINSVATSLKDYIPAVRTLCYALAGIIAIGGGISVYIKMNNEEQDVKKSIMMIVGACIFLIAAATFLPKFFGY